MKKATYVLDTNILLSEPNSLYLFGNSDVVLPFKVIEEIDKKKNLTDIIGSNARYTIRILDQLRKKGNLSKGVKLEKGKGLVFVKDVIVDFLPKDLDLSVPDNKILAIAFRERAENPSKRIVVVSKDLTVRIKADVSGFEATDIELNRVIDKKEQLYTGFRTIIFPDQVIDKFYSGEEIYLDDQEYNVYPNQFILLKSELNEKKTAISKFINNNTPLKKVVEYKNSYGIDLRNKEQICAMNLLMDPSLNLVSVGGIAGSGKSLISLLAGIEQTLGKNARYKRLIIIRPIQPMGREIGFLPGSITEKLEPYIAPIVDNLRFIFGNDQTMLDEYIKNGIIEIEALTFIRGRSIPNSYILLDESQNTNPHELKTVLTRAGEGTKIVLTADTAQIDNAYLNEYTNGFSNVVEKFKSEQIAGHITLIKGERSELATLASKIL